MQITKSPRLLFDAYQTPSLHGLYRSLDHLLLAQRETERQLLATCWLGESNTKGFTARFLAAFDLGILLDPEIAQILETWKHCPLSDEERRVAWLFALLFAKNLHNVALKYMCDYLPESEGPQLLVRLTRLHAGRLAFEELEGWYDDPLALMHAGETPILTASGVIAAGATVPGTVGIALENETDREYLVGELLAAHPEFVVVTDDLPEAATFVNQLQASGLQAYLYSEKN